MKASLALELLCWLQMEPQGSGATVCQVFISTSVLPIPVWSPASVCKQGASLHSIPPLQTGCIRHPGETHSPPTHPQQKQISKTKERKKDSVRIVIPYRRNILCFLFHQVKVLSWGLLSYSFWSFSAFVCLFRHFPLLGQLWFWIVKSILAMTHQGWSGNTTADVVSVHKHFYSSSWNEPLFAVVPK